MLILGCVLVAACSGDEATTSSATPAAQSGAPAMDRSTSPSVAGTSGGTPMAPTTNVAGQQAQTPGTRPMPNAGTGATPTMPTMPTTPTMPLGGTRAKPMDMMPPPTTGGAMPGGGILPKVDSTEMDGPFESMNGVSGSFYVWRPAELGKGGLKHPVFVWGTGAGAMPD